MLKVEYLWIVVQANKGTNFLITILSSCGLLVFGLMIFRPFNSTLLER